MMITALTTIVDLIKRPSVTLYDILSALTMGLVFLGVRISKQETQLSLF